MVLSNDNMIITVSEHGAELTSLKYNGREYLWNGDSSYWNRHSPVLFPVVGKPYNNELHINGNVYPMKQHGFARDSMFEQIDLRKNSVSFRMKDAISNDVYPYRFGLEVTYAIKGNKLNVSWCVKNLGECKMYYQIGAHPAFMLPDYDLGDEIHGYICFHAHNSNNNQSVSPVLLSRLEEGNRVMLQEPIQLPHKMPITANTFAGDALMIENRPKSGRSQEVSTVTLCNKQGKPVLSVDCSDADAYGIWAPHKEGCPFVCIEPWQGICDQKGFIDDISKRDIIRSINPGNHGRFEYSIALNE